MADKNYRRAPMTIFDLFNRSIDDLNLNRGSEWNEYGEQGDHFRVDVQEFAECYVLKADLPGCTKESIGLDFDHDTLSIAAPHHLPAEQPAAGQYVLQERQQGVYRRSFAFRFIDVSRIDASFDNGVLTVMLPKLQQSSSRPGIHIK